MKERPMPFDADHPRRTSTRTAANPVLALPGIARLQALPAPVRAEISDALRSIQADARVRAEKSWRTHKAPMAAYWKAVGVYAGHLARALS
jgi:hypothetical protein